jgi:hypothetical protein
VGQPFRIGCYDWHTGKVQIPPQGELVSSSMDSDITKWDAFEGDIPDLDESVGFFYFIIEHTQQWREGKKIIVLSQL